MAIILKSPEAKEEIIQQVISNWGDMKRERSELESTWERCLMAYLCEFDKKWADYAEAAHRSHRYVGISWDAIETLTPQIYDAALGSDDWLKIRPQRTGFDEVDDQWAEMQKYMCLYQHRQSGFNPTTRMGIKSMLVLGNCPWSMQWVTKKAVDHVATTEAQLRWLEKSQEFHQEAKQVNLDWMKATMADKLMGGQGIPKPQMNEPPRPPADLDIIYDGPKLIIGSIFNYVQEQYPNNPDEALRIMRTWRTKAFLREEAKPDDMGYRRYSNISSLHDMESEDRSKDNSVESMMKRAIGMDMPYGKDKVELKSQYGTFELNGAHGEKAIYKNYVVVIGNDNTLLQCEPAPMLSGMPTVNNAKLITYDGMVYGVGVLEKALPEQDTANAILNQTVDATNAVIQPEYEVFEDGLVDGMMNPSGPGVRHLVSKQGSIIPLQKNFQGIPIGHEAVNAAIARHERITGAVNVASNSDESATRTARNSGIISTKLGGHVTSVEDNLITPAINMQMEMNAQYLEDDQIFTYTQDGRLSKYEVSIQDIRRGAVAFAAGSKYLAERQERIMNLQTLLQLGVESKASGQPSPFKVEKIAKNLAKEIMGESGDMVMSDEEFAAEVQAFQEQIMAQQAAEQEAAMNGAQGRPAQAGGGIQPGNAGPVN